MWTTLPSKIIFQSSKFNYQWSLIIFIVCNKAINLQWPDQTSRFTTRECQTFWPFHVNHYLPRTEKGIQTFSGRTLPMLYQIENKRIMMKSCFNLKQVHHQYQSWIDKLRATQQGKFCIDWEIDGAGKGVGQWLNSWVGNFLRQIIFIRPKQMFEKNEHM